MIKNISALPVLFLILFCTACTKDNDESIPHRDHGWTPIDSQETDNEPLPNILEPKPKADTALSAYLPLKIYDYLGDKEVEDASQKTQTGIAIKSVVRVYRKKDLMIGVQISDFSSVPAKDRTEIFKYHQKSLAKLAKKGDVLESLSTSKGNGKVFYSKRLKKSILIIFAADNLLVSISSDTQLPFQKIKTIPQLFHF